MKTRFTQWSMVVALLIGSLLNAQEDKGHVGINPKGENVRATLDVQVSSDNANGTTNEGIIYPTLNKDRLAKIADAKLVEGTVVYVNNVTYSGTNAKVSEVKETGLYYYNAADQKWKKLEGKNYTGENGVAVEGNKIKGAYQGGSGISINGSTVSIDEGTKEKVDKINGLNKNRLTVWHEVKLREDRSRFTGTAGTWNKIGGSWVYGGLVSIYAYYNTINHRFEPVDYNGKLGGWASKTYVINRQVSAVRPLQLACTHGKQGKSTGRIETIYDVNSATNIEWWNCGFAAQMRSDESSPVYNWFDAKWLKVIESDAKEIDTYNGSYVLVRPVSQLWYYDE